MLGNLYHQIIMIPAFGTLKISSVDPGCVEFDDHIVLLGLVRCDLGSMDEWLMIQ